ncbi:uncharacterized mitochondrial protein AtMg00810-like [Rutidosis leptorrhynchoides]|uniref:uncharacterized mitochondrial protein AtMg00810-like n=1 Tax=Rutidosis leptorrhynchoides TaxID=125765 RepID=UPI003A99970F
MLCLRNIRIWLIIIRGLLSHVKLSIDYHENFSLVVKSATIRTVLIIATSKSWPIHQLNVKNAFLHGNLKETVYMYQPVGFRDPSQPNHVCLLQHSLYGLKQAPRAWYQRFADYADTIGFKHSKCDHYLSTHHHGSDVAYLLLYVDDIVLTTSNDRLRRTLIGLFAKELDMKDLGPLNSFLGISVTRSAHGLFLSQQAYVMDIIQRAGLVVCNSVATPIDRQGKISSSLDKPVTDPIKYRSLAGALQYLTFTRPISYAVQQVCIHMHDPRETHMDAIKRIIRYLTGMISLSLLITRSTSHNLVAYTDADWGGCPDSHRSTSGYCIYLGDNLISWSSKRQPTVSHSSEEAEYRGVANVVAESC